MGLVALYVVSRCSSGRGAGRRSLLSSTRLCAGLFPVPGRFFTAHTAASAAHAAGAASAGFGAVVCGDRSTVVGKCPVGIDRRITVSIAGEIQRTAIDCQSAIGVDTVTIRDDGRVVAWLMPTSG